MDVYDVRRLVEYMETRDELPADTAPGITGQTVTNYAEAFRHGLNAG